MPLLPRALALAALLGLAACNTVAGFGQDMQRAGSAIERESYDAQTDTRQRPTRGY